MNEVQMGSLAVVGGTVSILMAEDGTGRFLRLRMPDAKTIDLGLSDDIDPAPSITASSAASFQKDMLGLALMSSAPTLSGTLSYGATTLSVSVGLVGQPPKRTITVSAPSGATFAFLTEKATSFADTIRKVKEAAG